MVTPRMVTDLPSGCVQLTMVPGPRSSTRGHKVFFHAGIQYRQLVVIPGIHHFDAHRLQPELLATLDRQFDPGTMKLASPEAARDTVSDPSSDEGAASTDGESDPEDPTISWCPLLPEAAEDPSEDEILSAADKLAMLIDNIQPDGNLSAYQKTLAFSRRYGSRRD